MPRPKKYHEKLAESIRGAEEPETTDDVSELQKTEVQQRIMHPEGTPIALSYGEILVYPFVMRDKRRAGGYIAQVSADAVGAGARSEDEMKLRFASLLMRRDDLESELFRLAATACFKPGTASESKVLPIVAEFQQKCAASDVLILFATITDLAEFSVPKL